MICRECEYKTSKVEPEKFKSGKPKKTILRLHFICGLKREEIIKNTGIKQSFCPLKN